MASLNYDLVVLGNDFSGLVAACLCASRGMRVLLAQTSKAEFSYRVDTDCLPLHSAALAGLGSAAVQRVVAELHFEHLFKRRLEQLSPPCQFLGPDLCIAFDTRDVQLLHALERELAPDHQWLANAPDTSKAFASLCQSEACLPPVGFWERREVTRLMAPIRQESQVWGQTPHGDSAETISELALCAGLQTGEDSALSRAHSLTTLRAGLSGFDRQAWQNIFMDKFLSHNGDVRQVHPLALEQSWGKVTALKTLEDHISFDYLIASLPQQELLPLFGSKPPKRLQELSERTKPSAFRYTMSLAMDRAGLPQGMGKVMWSQLHAGRPGTDGNIVEFNVSEAKQEGKVVVTLAAYASVADDGTPELDGMREAILEHAGIRMPFFEDHLDAAHSPLDLDETALDSPNNQTASNRLPALWDTGLEPSLALPASPYLVGPKHLCIANSQTLPTLGLEGEFIAAWSAAKLATASTGSRKKVGKPSVLQAEPPKRSGKHD